MEIRRLSTVEENASGIYRISWPHFWLGNFGNGAESGDWVIFLGADFKNMAGVDVAKFIEKTNQCLEYIRKNCVGCQLIYRPHPEEKDEMNFLNLASFAIQKDYQVAEDYLWANRERIKYVFSVYSTSSIIAFNMGLNSYSFYHYFKDILDDARKIFIDNYFCNLPTPFFIGNLDTPLLGNKMKLKEDNKLRENFKRILIENEGPVWLIVVENKFRLAIIGLARMIRGIFPGRRINLIISKHHRWTEKYLQDLGGEFDEILVFPRHFYSLRPTKLLSAFITARKIKRLQIERGSVFIGFAHHDFIENCFMSYNKNGFRASFLMEGTWRLNFKTEELGFDPKKFLFNKASFFYNHFFEPLLGLNRTKFQHYGGSGDLYFIRLAKPIEKIYDEVYLIKNLPI